MGPSFAAKAFKQLYDDKADRYEVTLYGSLAATGKGHMTDVAIENELKPKKVTFIWKANETLTFQGPYRKTFDPVYKYSTMKSIMRWCRKTGYKLNDYVYQSEDDEIHSYLLDVWTAMKRCVEIGLQGKGVLPGGLNLPRKARDMYRAAERSSKFMSVGSLARLHR